VPAVLVCLSFFPCGIFGQPPLVHALADCPSRDRPQAVLGLARAETRTFSDGPQQKRAACRGFSPLTWPGCVDGGRRFVWFRTTTVSRAEADSGGRGKGGGGGDDQAGYNYRARVNLPRRYGSGRAGWLRHELARLVSFFAAAARAQGPIGCSRPGPCSPSVSVGDGWDPPRADSTQAGCEQIERGRLLARPRGVTIGQWLGGERLMPKKASPQISAWKRGRQRREATLTLYSPVGPSRRRRFSAFPVDSMFCSFGGGTSRSSELS
jgi:hypothetical protein